MCKKCWNKFKDYHKTSTESLLARYNYIVSFKTTPSRWGLVTMLIAGFQISMALFFALYGWYLSLYFIYRPWEWHTSMNIWILLLWIGSMFCFAVALIWIGFTLWIGIYFIRTPLQTTPELEAIKKLDRKRRRKGRRQAKKDSKA